MKINSITTLDLIGFIKESLSQHKISFSDWINDRRKNGEREVDYWFVLKDETGKNIVWDKLRIISFAEEMLTEHDEAKKEEELLIIARTLLISHALYMLVHNHVSQKISLH